jgi:hypothetical protein
LVVRGNNSLTINIALSETVTHFSAIVWYWGSQCNWTKCKVWTVLRSTWTKLLQEKKTLCRSVLSYW